MGTTTEKKFFGIEYDPKCYNLKAISADEPYTRPEPLAAHDPMRYLQPWTGYEPECTLPKEDALRLPVQTANIKQSLRYTGVELCSNKWMDLACEQALASVKYGGGPFCSVIVQIDDERNKVIRYWVGWNHVVEWCDPTAHGEVTTIRQACNELGVFDLGKISKSDPMLKLPQECEISHCELYSSAEPCPMCYAATRWARIDHIFFAATIFDAAQQGIGFLDEPIYAELALSYKDRQKTGAFCYQCTTGNSLDAFNHYKRSGAGKY